MINLNNEFVSNKQANLNITNRAIAYGDALFETIRVVKGEILFWEDHYFRLMSSMRILRMKIPMNFTLEFLEKEIFTTIKSNGLTQDVSLRVKLTVYRDSEGLYTPNSNEVGYFIQVKRLDNSRLSLNSISDSPYIIELFKDHYVNAGLLSNLKSTNRIINTLAGIFAKENDFHNLLLLNHDKKIIEAINGNVFVVKGNTITTPPLSDGCINGVFRKQLINTIKKKTSFTVEEKSISPFELQKSDEIFITNAILGIQSVSKYRKKSFVQKVAKALIVHF